MRLIDADELRQEWLENGENEYIYDTNSFLDSIDDQPTINPETFPIARELREQLKKVTAVRDELKKSIKWISVKDRMPDNEQFVLIIASGKPRENITLENAVVLAEYGSEGWILEMWPEWSDPNVTYWMPLPEPPKEE